MITGVCVKGKITQGDTYPIPVYVTVDGSIATPENISGLKLRIGKFTAWWPNGKLENENGVWLFPLTAEQSKRLDPGYNEVQARVSVGKYDVGTAVTKVYVGKSLI